MVAHGTHFGSLRSNYNMSAIATNPNAITFTGKYFGFFYIVKQCLVTFLMTFFYFRHHFEFYSQFFKTFFTSFFCESGIHFGPFVVFALGSVFQISFRIGNSTVMQGFEPYFGVFFFIIGSFFKKCSYLLIAVFLCAACIIGVFVSCLAFACKSSEQVLFGLCSF